MFQDFCIPVKESNLILIRKVRFNKSLTGWRYISGKFEFIRRQMRTEQNRHDTCSSEQHGQSHNGSHYIPIRTELVASNARLGASRFQSESTQILSNTNHLSVTHLFPISLLLLYRMLHLVISWMSNQLIYVVFRNIKHIPYNLVCTGMSCRLIRFHSFSSFFFEDDRTEHELWVQCTVLAGAALVALICISFDSISLYGAYSGRQQHKLSFRNGNCTKN